MNAPHEQDARNAVAVFETRRTELANNVIDLIGTPVDSTAVHVILESMGFRDSDIRSDYDCAGLTSLAEDIYHRCYSDMRERMEEHSRLMAKKRLEHLNRSLPGNSHGFVLLIPVAGQVAALFSLDYSLWTYLYFTELQATIVALAAFFSFIVTGGFAQLISREGFAWFEKENVVQAGENIVLLLKLGVITSVALAIAATLTGLFFAAYSPQDIFFGITYFALLSGLWLFLAVLFALREYLRATLMTLIGIIPVFLVMEFSSRGIFAAHAAGMICTDLGLLLLIRNKLGIRVDDLNGIKVPYDIRHLKRPLPDFFLTGLLFYLFIFADRFVSWSTGNLPGDFLVWFRIPYELGLDWALLAFLLTVGSLEIFLNRFSRLVFLRHELEIYRKSEQLPLLFRSFYTGQISALLIFGAINIIIVYYAVSALQYFQSAAPIHDFFSNSITYFTFIPAAAGYLFLAVGLMNGLIFFTLSRPDFVLRGLVPALLVNIITGLILSRLLGYEYGVFGLTIGSFVYALISSYLVVQVFDQFDYYYYAGF
jgi:hypothetical protein